MRYGFLSLQVNTTCVCSVVRIKSEVDVLLNFTTEPLNGTKLEFSVSTEDTGLKYNSKYNTTVENRHGSRRSKVQLSKYLLLGLQQNHASWHFSLSVKDYPASIHIQTYIKCALIRELIKSVQDQT